MRELPRRGILASFTHRVTLHKIVRMILTDSDVAEFQVAYQKVYNETITSAEARVLALHLLRLYRLLMRSAPSHVISHLAKGPESGNVDHESAATSTRTSQPSP